MAEHHEAAKVLLAWIDGLTDPYALALAISQAEEASLKALHTSCNLEAAQSAYIRRFVESIALDNAGLMRKLTARAAGGRDG